MRYISTYKTEKRVLNKQTTETHTPTPCVRGGNASGGGQRQSEWTVSRLLLHVGPGTETHSVCATQKNHEYCPRLTRSDLFNATTECAYNRIPVDVKSAVMILLMTLKRHPQCSKWKDVKCKLHEGRNSVSLTAAFPASTVIHAQTVFTRWDKSRFTVDCMENNN